MRCERCKKEKNETTRFCMHCGHDHGNSEGENRISHTQVKRGSAVWKAKLSQQVNKIEDAAEYEIMDEEGTISFANLKTYFTENFGKIIMFFVGLGITVNSFGGPITEAIYNLEQHGFMPDGVAVTVGNFFNEEINPFDGDYIKYVYEDIFVDEQYSNQLGPALEYSMEDLSFTEEYTSLGEPIIWASGLCDFENELIEVEIKFEYEFDFDVVVVKYVRLDGVQLSNDEGKAFLAQLFEVYEESLYE